MSYDNYFRWEFCEEFANGNSKNLSSVREKCWYSLPELLVIVMKFILKTECSFIFSLNYLGFDMMRYGLGVYDILMIARLAPVVVKVLCWQKLWYFLPG